MKEAANGGGRFCSKLNMQDCRTVSYCGMPTLTQEEFASLLTVGETPINSPAPVVPPEHSARLITLGYMADIAGRLRMTTPGRIRMAAGLRTN